MITPEYARLLKENHATRTADKPWGLSGGRNFGSRLLEFLRLRPAVKTVLDFGAGQLTLENYIKEHDAELHSRLVWTNYDPGITSLEETPEGLFDLIVSTDVLEHVEPDQVSHVLNWLFNHTKFYQYHLIACEPCGSTLPDGRNAHLSVHDPEWWHIAFKPYGTIMYYADEKVRKRSRARWYCCIQIDKTG